MKAFTVIAIDGMAAAGKTTTAKIIAGKYGLMRVSTGEHYRAIAHVLLLAGTSPDDVNAVERAMASIEIGNEIVGNYCSMTVSGVRVEDSILRSAEINCVVSQFSNIPSVRKFLFEYQRSQADVARGHGFFGLAIEGRDMTSVVFPDADLRFFLYADAGKREERRNCGGKVDYIRDRDSADQRVTVCQDGVIRIDTGANSLQEVEGIISRYVEEL
jgi:cytidylate kinase